MKLSLALAPLQIEFLKLLRPETVVEPTLDPTRLPFSQDRRDFNTDTAFLGSEMASSPFENTNLLLLPGLYLHWRMPQELTRGNPDGSHPELPNRWLVCREQGGGEKVLRKYWVVESDGVSGPHSRRLGRTVELKQWLAGLPGPGTVGSLTVMGHSEHPPVGQDEGAVGNPAFAAFFPDCRGVFSFCDPDLVASLKGTSYVVSGWYSDPAKDPLARVSGVGTVEPLEKEIDPAFLNELLEQVKRLEQGDAVEPTSVDQSPEEGMRVRTLYTGRVAFVGGSMPQASLKKSPLHDRETSRSKRLAARRGHQNSHAHTETIIALGHTATEALSAFLAEKIDRQQRARIEDQLEAILMASDLEHRLQDQHAKFLEGRHQKEFLASQGGTHWVIKDEPISSLPAQADGAKPPDANLVPVESLTLLHDLNKLQRQIDRLQHHRATLHRRLAADWSKYMLAAHPQPGSREEFPDPDLMAFRLRKDSLEPLTAVDDSLAQLRTQRDALARQIFATLPAVKSSDLSKLVLKAVPGPRYWAPRDPVVVLEAPDGLRRHLPSSAPDQPLPQVQKLSLSDAANLRVASDEQTKMLAEALAAVQYTNAPKEFVWIEDAAPAGAQWQGDDPWEFVGKDAHPVFSGEKIHRQTAVGNKQHYFTGANPPLKVGEGDKFFQYVYLDPGNPPKEIMLQWNDGTWEHRAYWGGNHVEWGTNDSPSRRRLGDLPKAGEWVRLEIDCAQVGISPGASVNGWAFTQFDGSVAWDRSGLIMKPPQTSQSPHGECARPIFVEWAAQLTSLVRPDESGSGNFQIDSLTSRFAPAATGPDLQLRTAQKEYPENGSRFAGRSLVSAHAGRVLHERLKDYLLRYFDKSWPGAPALDANKPDSEVQAERLAWLEDPDKIKAAIAHLSASSGSLADTALKAWRIVRDGTFLCLTLGGFNEALLMRRRAAPLPVADPIGFPVYRDFAEEVRNVVGTLPGTAPEPLFDFHPIREGLLEIERLRIIDSFGRPYDVNFSKAGVILATPLRKGLPEGRTGGAVFPPRFVQPMRVDFRWLSASHGHEEAHSHPDTSPLCGWLLPNRFDESIEVYAADGAGLGSIDVSGLWRSVPGDDHPIVPRDIANPHLRRVVLHILEQSRDGRYQQAFLQTINAALEAIDPDSFAASPSLAILIGRPLAVVRASVKFELQGEPAEDHSWPMLARRLAGEKPHLSRAFENIRIPFRIGEHGMFNDGVAGYWVEPGQGEGFDPELLHAPQTDVPQHPRIASNHHTSLGENNTESQSLILSRAPADPPLRLTLLMDPRGAAHLTSGVLPVKQIRIDEHHFATALRSMSVTFLSAPLLMSQDRTEVMLPGEPGFAWSFLDRTPDGWRETAPQDIKLPELGATFHPGISLREGWLRLTPVETPTADKRNSAT